jgi:RNA polymerase sigma factor (sigma-70 family)
VTDVGERVARSETATSEDDRLFAEIYPALHRLAAAVRPPHVEADDLVQEAVARTLRARGELGKLDDPTGYLCRTILRLASNERRRWRRGRDALARMRSPGTTSDHAPSDLAYLALVEPADRAVLYLTAVDGRSHAEVAALLGCTEEAARARAARARHRLRVALDKDAQ